MMQATDFEFRNRWWVFGFIFSLSFLFLAFDHIPAGARLAQGLAARAEFPESLALRIVFGGAALIMIAAALVRTWGSSYLGREVVHDQAVHSEVLHADGPYRHVRNPLYLGNVLMALAVGLLVPAIGWPLLVIGITVFCYRLIGREEAALEPSRERDTALSCTQSRGRGRRLVLGFRLAEVLPIGLAVSPPKPSSGLSL